MYSLSNVLTCALLVFLYRNPPYSDPLSRSALIGDSVSLMLVILRRFRKRNRLFPVLATPEPGGMLYGKNGKKLTHFQLTIDHSAWTIDYRHRPSCRKKVI